MDINNLLASMTGNTQQRIGTIQAQVGDMQQDTAAMRSLMDTNVQAGQKLAMDAALENQKMEFAREKHEQAMDFAEQKFAMEMMMKERDCSMKNDQHDQKMEAMETAAEMKSETSGDDD